MAKKKGGNAFTVSVEGLSELQAIPGWIDQGQKIFLDKAARGIALEVAKRAPGGPAGKAGRDVEALAISARTAIVRSRGFKGAPVLERGGMIVAKKGSVLRFEVDGQIRFARRVKIKGRGYWRKGLRSRGKIVRGAYHEAFGNLERNRG